MKNMEQQIKFIEDRVDLLGDVDRHKYFIFCGYVGEICERVGYVNKDCKVKLFILDNLEYNNEQLFEMIKCLIYELDLISTKTFNRYFLHDNQLVKYA